MFRRCNVLLLALLSGCAPTGPELPPTDLIYESPHLHIFAEPGLTSCAGNGPSMDRSLEFLAAELQLGEVQSPLEVFWISPERFESEGYCDGTGIDDAVACTWRESNRVITPTVPAEHELVHAYLGDRIEGELPSFFNEGLAVLYARDVWVRAPDTNIRDAVTFVSEQLPGHHYPRAAHFVAYVLDEHGPELMGSFLRRVAGSAEYGQVEDAFAETFGETLDAFVSRYEADAPGCDGYGWTRSWECDAQPDPWAFPFLWEGSFDLSCPAGGAIGEDGGRVTMRVPLEVELASTHSLRILSDASHVAPDDYRAEVRSCGGCENEQLVSHDVTDGGLFGFELEAGRYVVHVSRKAEAAPQVSVRLSSP